MSMLSGSLFRVSLLTALCCVHVSGWAQAYGGFSSDTIYGSLNREESKSFNDAAQRVLRDPQDGKVLLWQSPVTRHKSISGQLYADGAREQNGLPCRQLHAGLRDSARQEDWSFWFCQSGGQWKVLSQSRQ